MRQLWIQVPDGYGNEVVEITDAHEGQNLALWRGEKRDRTVEILSVSISNHRIQSFLEQIQALPDPLITFAPHGVFVLHPPHSETPQQVTDVEERSPIEILLGGLQSIGSWRGFLGYAVAAGIVAWIGLFTDTVFLLIAAMLIAPFAGPAMNLALASAQGDLILMRRSLLRYAVALAVGIFTAGLLSVILQQEIATSQMVSTSKVSSVAVLLPLIAGAAGAISLVQSERSSLVSGAATGLLVAASLAPPAALVGMAAVLQEWGMVLSGVFLLSMQLFGINLAGALLFRYYGGIATGKTRYERGHAWVFPVSLTVSVMALAGLLFWQFTGSPDLFQSTREQRAKADVQQVISESGLAHLVEANLRFSQPNISNQNTLLATIYVQKARDADLPEAQIDQRLTGAIEERLMAAFEVTPLVDVQVMTAPPETRINPDGRP